jgi:hypothetical protein
MYASTLIGRARTAGWSVTRSQPNVLTASSLRALYVQPMDAFETLSCARRFAGFRRGASVSVSELRARDYALRVREGSAQCAVRTVQQSRESRPNVTASSKERIESHQRYRYRYRKRGDRLRDTIRENARLSRTGVTVPLQSPLAFALLQRHGERDQRVRRSHAESAVGRPE